jgi:hypothetical protein
VVDQKELLRDFLRLRKHAAAQAEELKVLRGVVRDLMKAYQRLEKLPVPPDDWGERSKDGKTMDPWRLCTCCYRTSFDYGNGRAHCKKCLGGGCQPREYNSKKRGPCYNKDYVEYD